MMPPGALGIWQVGFVVGKDVEFAWYGKANSAQAAKDGARVSAKRCWTAATLVRNGDQHVPVRLKREPSERGGALFHSRQIHNGRKIFEEGAYAPKILTPEEEREVIAAAARTMIAVHGLPKGMDAFTLHASVTDSMDGWDRLLTCAQGEDDVHVWPFTPPAETLAVLEILAIVRFARTVLEGSKTTPFAQRVEYGGSGTMRCALMADASERLSQDCLLLGDFARRYGDRPTAEEYNAIGRP